MLCKNPYMGGAIPFGCGQCGPCRINRRRIWTHRILLETFSHAENSFATLTYSPEQMPKDGSLCPEHTRNWLKRLRRAISPARFRFFLVGEYGDQTQRPHYHAALFNIPPSAHELVERTWGKGHIMLGDLTVHSAQYIAGYVVKKMTAKDDPCLEGRYPEFSRMSLRPGLGAFAMEDVAEALFSEHGAEQLKREGDVPFSLKHGRKSFPLGRYLRQKLRDELGVPDEVKKWSLYEKSQEMRELYEISKTTKEVSVKKILLKKHKQKVRNFEAKHKLYTKRRTL